VVFFHFHKPHQRLLMAKEDGEAPGESKGCCAGTNQPTKVR
jgi:hypothetical protein